MLILARDPENKPTPQWWRESCSPVGFLERSSARAAEQQQDQNEDIAGGTLHNRD